MTRNQLMYQELNETKRANRARERETKRSNIAKEKIQAIVGIGNLVSGAAKLAATGF